jgi:hypothetical protein
MPPGYNPFAATACALLSSLPLPCSYNPFGWLNKADIRDLVNAAMEVGAAAI